MVSQSDLVSLLVLDSQSDFNTVLLLLVLESVDTFYWLLPQHIWIFKLTYLLLSQFLLVRQSVKICLSVSQIFNSQSQFGSQSVIGSLYRHWQSYFNYFLSDVDIIRILTIDEVIQIRKKVPTKVWAFVFAECWFIFYSIFS